MDLGKQILGRRHVLPDTIDLVHEIQVEGTFPDGTYLVTVHEPICTDNGNLEMALYGTFYPIPDESKFPLPTTKRSKEDKPGAIIALPSAPIQLNANRKRLSLTVTNHGDRAVQVSCFNVKKKCRNNIVNLFSVRLVLIIILSKQTGS